MGLQGIPKGKEMEQWLNAMPIDVSELMELKRYLSSEIAFSGCGHGMELTGRFLRFYFPQDRAEILGWILDQGIACDCELEVFIPELLQYLASS